MDKQNKGPGQQDKKDRLNTEAAHQEAEKDIERDPDLPMQPNKEDDLDEGELARLEGED